MTNETRESLQKRAADMARDLGEHFEHVQILCSVQDEEGTHKFYRGSGNWFARQGMAHDFIKCEESELAAHYIGNKIKEGE